MTLVIKGTLSAQFQILNVKIVFKPLQQIIVFLNSRNQKTKGN